MKKSANSPLVSVLLPSYNHEKYIKYSILSVIDQTYQNIELIIIDDGSTDSTHQVIKKLLNTYDFQYKHRENKGLAKTLNELLSMSNGKYIALFSSDDKWDSNKIEEQVSIMEYNDKIELCFTDFYVIDQKGEIQKNAQRFSYEKHQMSFYDVNT